MRAAAALAGVGFVESDCQLHVSCEFGWSERLRPEGPRAPRCNESSVSVHTVYSA